MSKTPTLAIDFGTSRTKVAYFDENRNEPRLVEIGRAVRDLIPSIFYVPKESDGKILVGDDAEEMIEHDPGGIVVALKKEIHKLNKVPPGKRRKTERIELASYLFQHIKEFAESHVSVFQGKNIDSCTLTVPVCFLTPQRDAIRQAAEKGGLRNIRIIEEPVAAARSWLWETHVQGIKSVIVCDIGGGTTDFAAVKLERGAFLSIPEILPGGFTEGGDNIDDQIVDLLRDEDEETDDRRSGFWAMIGSIRGAVKSKVRKIKEFVSRTKQDQFVHLQGEKIPVAQETVNRCISNFIDRTCGELENYLKVCREKLDDEKVPILLVGGSSKLPGLEDRVKQIAGTSPVHRWERSDYAIVLGATLEGKATGFATEKQTPSRENQEVPKAASKEDTARKYYDLAMRYHNGYGVARDYKEALRNLLIAGESGHIEAQCLLGEYYYEGWGAQKNMQESARWYAKAAVLGSGEAQVNLGLYYIDGDGVSKNVKRGIELIEKSAAQKHLGGLLTLGRMYRDGSNVPQNLQKAMDLFERATEKDQDMSTEELTAMQYELGFLCLYCPEPQQDEEKAAQWFRKAAEKGFAAAQFELGNCYFSGIGVPQNDEKAIEWLQKSVGQGYAEAENMLGICYLNGRGVSENGSEAYRWTKMAAEKELAVAQYNMGFLYESGIGVAENPQEAASWYQLAANQECVGAITRLGLCYQNGYGVPQNHSRAVKLFKMAVEQGDAEAQNALGMCYMNGVGVPQIPTEGIKLIHEAAEQGFLAAMCNLGFYYFEGIGVVQNLDKAIEWMRYAAEAGDQNAIEWLNEIAIANQGTQQTSPDDSPLHKSAQYGDMNSVERFLKSGADPNAQDKEGRTPLFIASREGNIKTILLLLQYGADPEKKDNKGRTSISVAKSVEVLNVLRGGQPKSIPPTIASSSSSSSEGTSLGEIAGAVVGGAVGLLTGNPMVAAFGAASGARIGKSLGGPKMGWNTSNAPSGIKAPLSLHKYAEYGDSNPVEKLLQNGTDPNLLDGNGSTALHYAAKAGNIKTIGVLISYGANPQIRDSNRQTAFDVAKNSDAKRALQGK